MLEPPSDCGRDLHVVLQAARYTTPNGKAVLRFAESRTAGESQRDRAQGAEDEGAHNAKHEADMALLRRLLALG
jgi:hypothetical protein